MCSTIKVIFDYKWNDWVQISYCWVNKIPVSWYKKKDSVLSVADCRNGFSQYHLWSGSLTPITLRGVNFFKRTRKVPSHYSKVKTEKHWFALCFTGSEFILSNSSSPMRKLAFSLDKIWFIFFVRSGVSLSKFYLLNISRCTYTAQNMKISINDFFSKCDQIRSFLPIWSYLLKKSLIENFIFFRSEA